MGRIPGARSSWLPCWGPGPRPSVRLGCASLAGPWGHVHGPEAGPAPAGVGLGGELGVGLASAGVSTQEGPGRPRARRGWGSSRQGRRGQIASPSADPTLHVQSNKCPRLSAPCAGDLQACRHGARYLLGGGAWTSSPFRYRRAWVYTPAGIGRVVPAHDAARHVGTLVEHSEVCRAELRRG